MGLMVKIDILIFYKYIKMQNDILQLLLCSITKTMMFYEI